MASNLTAPQHEVTSPNPWMERFRTVSFEPGGETVVEIHRLDRSNQPETKTNRREDSRRRRAIGRRRDQRRGWNAA